MGGQVLVIKTFFFSKDQGPLESSNNRKRKNKPKYVINKNYDNKNFHILLIQKIEDKFKYLNPFTLSNDVKKVLPKSINADILPYGDIRVFFENINDRMESKILDVKPVFGKEATIVEPKGSIFKIVIHSIPRYIKENDLKNYFEGNSIITKEIIIKPLKNNDHFGTGFVSLDNKAQYDEITKKGYFIVSNRTFKVSKYVNKKVVQCYRCQKYGHTAAICYNKDVKCRFCSKNHESKNCDQKNNLKCANCGENHKSSAYNCKIRQGHIIQKNKWLLKNTPDLTNLNIENSVIKEAKKMTVKLEKNQRKNCC